MSGSIQGYFRFCRVLGSMDQFFLIPAPHHPECWILELLHVPNYPTPGEQWYYSIQRSCRIFSINRKFLGFLSCGDYALRPVDLASMVIS